MGASKSGKGKSKKGPKGKRKRAKAKLERQWGEDITIKSETRRGRKPTNAKIDDVDENVNETVDEKNASTELSLKSTCDDGIPEQSSDESTNDDDEEGFSALMKAIKSHNKYQFPNAEEDGSSSDDQVPLEVQSDSESDTEDAKSYHFLSSLVSCEPFSDRFSHNPMSGDEKSLEHHLLNIHNGETLKLDPELLPSPYNCDNCEIQLSKVLSSKFKLSSGDGISNEKHWKKISEIIVGSHFGEVLQRQSLLLRRKFDSTQSLLFPFLSYYADMLVTNIDSKQKRDATQAVVILHILNHVVTSRGRITKHDRRIRELERKFNDSEDSESWKRDQGYTRPTVLVLLPTRKSCHEFVQTLKSLLGCSIVENIDRFETEYGPSQVLEAEGRLKDEGNKLRRSTVIQQKGSEWNDLFGDDANDDDDFKIGLSLNTSKMSSKQKKKNCSDNNYTMKLYSDFYKSDIILASPLGMKILTLKDTGDEDPDNEDDASNEPNNTADFLSSIEICLITRADVLCMQNWDHVNDVMSLINQQPKTVTSYTDFSRVRQYLLDGHSASWRQLICFSSYSEPSIMSTFKRYSKSVSGLMRCRKNYMEEDASISDVIIPAQRQVFHRFPCTSFTSQSEDRIKYFAETLLPKIIRNKQKNIMIFVASYFDFVSLRNILQRKETLEFVSITEYTRTSEVSRNRTYFLKGHVPVLLYTGRAHFFHRHAIKGARHLIFLGLPENPSFYPEHVNRLKHGLTSEDDKIDVTESTCVTLFCRFDSQALERIVGTKHCRRMIKDSKQTFVFSS